MPTTVNIDEIKQKISIINTQSAKINNQRSVNLGKKQATESQLSALLKSYKEQYGVDLTPETLDAEIQSVVAKHEEEYNKLSQVISVINAGNYDLANQLLGIETKKEDDSEAVHLNTETLSSTNDIAQSVEVPVQSSNTEDYVPPVVNTVKPPVGAVPPVANIIKPSVSPVATSVPPVAGAYVGVAKSISPATVKVPPVVNANVVSVGATAPQVHSKQSSQLSGTEFMNDVQDNTKAPISALEGFTKNGHVLTGLEEPNLDVAPAVNKPKSFGDIIGSNQFSNNRG